MRGGAGKSPATSPFGEAEGLFDVNPLANFDDEEELERDISKLRQISDDIWNHFRPPQVSVDGSQSTQSSAGPRVSGTAIPLEDMSGAPEGQKGEGLAGAGMQGAGDSSVLQMGGMGRGTPPNAATFASIDTQELDDDGADPGYQGTIAKPIARRASEAGGAALSITASETDDEQAAVGPQNVVIEANDPNEGQIEQPERYCFDMFRDSRECKAWTVGLMEDPTHSDAAWAISIVVLLFIMISTITIVVESLPQYDNDESRLHFFIVECVAIFVFTAEYFVRLWAHEDRWGYVKSPLNMIDLVAIIPFYLDLLLLAVAGSEGGELSLLRLFRLVRILRVFKLSRYNSNIVICMSAMVESQDTLGLMGFMLSIVVIVFSAFIFFFEHGDATTFRNDDNSTYTVYMVEDVICTATSQQLQGCLTWPASNCDPCKTPGTETFVTATSPKILPSDCVCKYQTKFESIPGAFWWTLVTMMTVGYGDLYPLTLVGKLVAVVAMLCSIVILALPISVIGANFSRAWMERKELDERYMDGHEVSIVYRNLIHNLSEHNSILEDILCEASSKILTMQEKITEARQEYKAQLDQEGESVVDPRGQGLPPPVEPNPRLARLLASIDHYEEEINEAMVKIMLVQNSEYNQSVAQAICKCAEMERMVAEQCILSAKIEAREKQTMGRLLAVPQREGHTVTQNA